MNADNTLVIPSKAAAGQVETGMTMLVWHRHSCRCWRPSEGYLSTGKSACATQFWRRQRIGHSERSEESASLVAALKRADSSRQNLALGNDNYIIELALPALGVLRVSVSPWWVLVSDHPI